ncbi:gamma-glutamyltransferase [Pleionea sp. CnH1-48]|uniref:gamma-glutamyltransferase n=1 Tax=Pleionea sp. CnH1-48 TaxID=2954494 RepID=UPI00209835F8|nr:gamma-glutamyltransferase [Pleionea sp. CnH1-48]MCO7226072.1 gamma-glutamyltransferase [Pleionea sp. CnH1-48]
MWLKKKINALRRIGYWSLAVWGLLWSTQSYADNALIEWHPIYHPIEADAGMVATQEHRASRIGAEVLARGGNAVDAAVAIGFSEAVTLPKAGNIGGGGFMLIYLAKEQKTIAIDYREAAPAAAFRDMFLDDKGDVDKNKSRYSSLSSGVPGTVAGMLHALKHYGSISRQEAIQPAIDLAAKGFVADRPYLASLDARKKRLLKDPEFARVYFNQSKPYQVGDLIKLPELAWTLTQIKKKGRDGFYKGPVAEKIADYMSKSGGLISVDDLANYQIKERKAVTGNYRGYQVISMPPPSSGGIHIIQALNILERFPMASMGWGSAQHVHTMTEAFKRIYADRSQFLGDPDFVKIPAKDIMSKDYAKALAKNISSGKATPSSAIKAGVLHAESPQTTHYSVMDKWGNIVTNTYTLNFSFGSGKVVPGTGIILNNEMDDFSSKPGVPNAYGLIGGEANAIEGGKRPLSSMTPTIVMKDGQPVLVTGSPGGSRIITAVIHQIVNLVDFKMNIAEACSVPRFHHQWYPDKLMLEKGYSPDTVRALQGMGHNVVATRAFGSVQSVAQDKDGKYLGASDPRRLGAQAVGVTKNGTLVFY